MFGKKTISKQEYNEWLVGFEADNYLQEKREKFAQKYGNNRMDGLDWGDTLDQLKDKHIEKFKSGEPFPPQYKDFLNAANRDGYEIARCGSVFQSRVEMIEDYKLTNDHYSTRKTENGFESKRRLSRQGVDILAMCEAWDYVQEYNRHKQNGIQNSHIRAQQEHRRKIYDMDAREINGGFASEKKAEKQLAVVSFQNETVPNDSDFLDDFANGIKNIFGFGKRK